MKWTRFYDMHSGGGCKVGFEHIYIEAPEGQAKAAFERRFGRDPENTTCDCCGQDYSIDSQESLEMATAFERGCDFDKAAGRYVERPSPDKWRTYVTLEEWLARPDVLVIHAEALNV